MMSRWVVVLVVAAALAFDARSLIADEARDTVIVETLKRLKKFDLSERPDLKEAVLRHADRLEDSEAYLELVEQFQLTGAEIRLLAFIEKEPAGNAAAKAARLLVDFGLEEKLQAALTGENVETAKNTATALGNAGGAKVLGLLGPMAINEEVAPEVRTTAARMLGGNVNGQQQLLDWTVAGKLPEDVKLIVGDALLHSATESIRKQAGDYFELPKTASAEPLPPLSKLVAMRGDAKAGTAIFAKKGECAKCHKINGQGKEVGPDLSEIGSKLSRDAFYVAILDPSAGISHNYESYSVLTEEGQIIAGILVSETDDQVVLKDAGAIVHTIPRDNIDGMKKQKTSLMPSDLQKNLTTEDLVNVVEYLTTLKKK